MLNTIQSRHFDAYSDVTLGSLNEGLLPFLGRVFNRYSPRRGASMEGG